MGGRDICTFCNNEKILRKSPDIGEPLIEYYCPECFSPDETKYPKVTCPVCNGTGNIRKLTSSYNQGSITYRNNKRNKICYMCNGKGEINIISRGKKKLKNNLIKKDIRKDKKSIPQRKLTYKTKKERNRIYGYNLPLKYKLFDITKKLIIGIVLFGIFIGVFTVLPMTSIGTNSGSYNHFDKSISNIYNTIKTDFTPVTMENLKTNSSTRLLNYRLDGHNGYIKFIVYKGLDTWIAKQPQSISYDSGSSPPTKKDFIIKDLSYKPQVQALNELVRQIQNIAHNHNNQARIAISLVQNIPYDNSVYHTNNFTERYPYQVIYDNKGVCGSKSELLAYLLKELGFGVVLFNFIPEDHMAVGIKSAPQYAYKNTGYAFIETTVPTIITDSYGTYINDNGQFLKLTSMPKVIKISNGYTFNASVEYKDSLLFEQLEKDKELNPYKYEEWENLVKEYGLKIMRSSSTNPINSINGGIKIIPIKHNTLNNIIPSENIIYNGIDKLKDHQFLYIPFTDNISIIHLIINATKPITVYVMNGSENKIIGSYKNNIIPMNAVIQNCKNNNFKKQVDLICKIGSKYTVTSYYDSMGILIYNEGIGTNTINMNIYKEN